MILSFFYKEEIIMDKEIYIALTGSVHGINIPVEKYTEEELNTIAKFLDDLNTYIPSNCRIDAIVILDTELD